MAETLHVRMQLWYRFRILHLHVFAKKCTDVANFVTKLHSQEFSEAKKLLTNIVQDHKLHLDISAELQQKLVANEVPANIPTSATNTGSFLPDELAEPLFAPIDPFHLIVEDDDHGDAKPAQDPFDPFHPRLKDTLFSIEARMDRCRGILVQDILLRLSQLFANHTETAIAVLRKLEVACEQQLIHCDNEVHPQLSLFVNTVRASFGA